MKKENNIIKNTLIITAVNLIMRSISVSFNAFLTNRIGSAGIGLFQLVMSVYSLAVTFSSAGIRLAATRLTVEINTLRKNDMNKSLALCIAFAGFCGSLIGFLLLIFSDFIGNKWIGNAETALPLKILAFSLPFISMSSALGGYFTAEEKVPQFSLIQMIEQGAKISITFFLLNKTAEYGVKYSVASIVTGMTAAEIFSFMLSMIYKTKSTESTTDKPSVLLSDFIRIAMPDAVGSWARNILLTIEHLLIPKGFEKSGSNSKAALSAYGNIHAMAMPLLLYPSAIISSFSMLLIPDIAKRNELGDKEGIDISASRNLKRTFIFSAFSALLCFIFAPLLSDMIYKTNEAAKYIRILSPLVPIMYLDMVTDGLLKGLDQQIYTMRYNIIDSLLCVILVYFILPEYSVKGYIFILYASEIINFYLSFNRLIKICDIRFSSEPREDNSMFFQLKRYSAFRKEYEYRKYRDRKKRSQVL